MQLLDIKQIKKHTLIVFVLILLISLVFFSSISSASNITKQYHSIPSILNYQKKETMFQYSVNVNGQKNYVTSYLQPINNSYVEIWTGVSESKKTQPNNLTPYVFPISELEFAIPTNKQDSFRVPHNNGTWNVIRFAKVNSLNLIEYSSVSVRNVKQGIDYHLKVVLVKHSDNLMNYLEKNRAGGDYYFFVPQLIPTPRNSNEPRSPVTSVITPPPGGGGGIGGIAYLSERDNTAYNYHIWHFATVLSVSSFTLGSSGWSSQLIAAVGTNNPFHNWWLKSKSISTSENSQHTEVTATGQAYFFGIFPLGPFDLWNAFPTVQVHIFSNGTMTAYIHDLITGMTDTVVALPYVWSDTTIFNGQFNGYQYSVQYIV